MPADRPRGALPLVAVFAVVAVAAAGAAALDATPGAGDASPSTADEEGAVVRLLEAPEASAYEGNLQPLGWVILDQQARPIEHHDATVRVDQDGPVFATEPSSGHDYDGVDRYWLGLLQAGPYEVDVEVPHNGSERTASSSGMVVPRELADAELSLDAPDQVPAGEPATLAYKVLDTEGGAPIEGAEVLVEVRDADEDRRVYQTTTNAPDGQHSVDVAFPTPGSYEVRLTAYQAGGGNVTAFEAFTTTHAVDVTEGEQPASGPATRQPLENTVERAESDEPYELFVAFDPYTSTSRWGKMRLSATVVDPASRTLVEGALVHATLEGPDGATLLETGTAAAERGVFELETAQPAEGDYTLTLEARLPDEGWTAHHETTFSVQSPGVPLVAGAYFVDLERPDAIAAGQPAELTLSVADALDRAYEHGEVAVTILDEGDVAFSGKLHTHESGRYPFTATFPDEGPYTLHADPFPTTPSPTVEHEGPERGEDRSFGLDVAPAPEANGAAGDAGDGTDDVPGLPAGLVVASLASLAAVARRR